MGLGQMLRGRLTDEVKNRLGRQRFLYKVRNRLLVYHGRPAALRGLQGSCSDDFHSFDRDLHLNGAELSLDYVARNFTR